MRIENKRKFARMKIKELKQKKIVRVKDLLELIEYIISH